MNNNKLMVPETDKTQINNRMPPVIQINNMNMKIAVMQMMARAVLVLGFLVPSSA